MNTFSVTVNGREVEASVQPRTHLADFLREELLLTGTHLGCEHGVCGACTVMIDGEPARACIAFAVACDDADVRTVEGFADDPLMDALRAAFRRRHALQCGYCTPGMLITAYDIVRRLPGAGRARIREELAGNLCRCTGYAGIVDAIEDVLEKPPAPGLPAAKGRDSAGIARALPRAENVPVVTPATPVAKQAAGPGAAANAIERSVLVRAPADDVWRVLRDPRTVVRCLPGAELAREPDGATLGLRFNVAIGPMRAQFEGDATLVYDDAGRSGHLEGAGLDGASRTRGEGGIDFALGVRSADSTDLAAAIRYRLSGPLAQFSRGAVVDAVVDRLLAHFAANLALAAAGNSVTDQRSIGGLKLALSAMWQRVRRLFSPASRSSRDE